MADSASEGVLDEKIASLTKALNKHEDDCKRWRDGTDSRFEKLDLKIDEVQRQINSVKWYVVIGVVLIVLSGEADLAELVGGLAK